jgi:hypothetical protein
MLAIDLEILVDVIYLPKSRYHVLRQAELVVDFRRGERSVGQTQPIAYIMVITGA